MSYGAENYLHHEGEPIPEDFQQQYGLGVVLGMPLVLPQAHAAAKPPCAFFLAASTACHLSSQTARFPLGSKERQGGKEAHK